MPLGEKFLPTNLQLRVEQQRRKLDWDNPYCPPQEKKPSYFSSKPHCHPYTLKMGNSYLFHPDFSLSEMQLSLYSCSTPFSLNLIVYPSFEPRK